MGQINLMQSRKSRGWSRMYLAEKLDINPRTVSKYEAGELRISLEILLKICAVFKMTPNDLLGFSSPERSESAVLSDDGVLNKDLVRVLVNQINQKDEEITRLKKLAKVK